MSKLSIVVPVYNAEKRLKKCLDSIVNQTIKDIDVVIVNDGSTDNSDKIIIEYKNRYSDLIKYYNKQNSGVADTRNYCIKKAESKYIIFVDSDDYIDTQLVEKLTPYMERDIDIVKYKLQKVNENGDVIEQIDGPTFEQITAEDGFNNLYCNDILIDSPCVYLMKKELFTNNKLKFSGKYHEDYGLIPIVLLYAKNIVSLDEYLYNYVQIDDSITRGNEYPKVIERFDAAIEQYDKAILTINQMDVEKYTKQNARIYYTNALILKLNELKKDDRKRYIRYLKNRKVYKNIKVRNIKQLLKKVLIRCSISLYLKVR